MRILFASSEVFPFSKTGGLADIAAFLPKAIKQHGIDIKIVTPYYQSIGKYHQQMKFVGSTPIRFGGIETIVNYYEMMHEGVGIVFVQNMHYFERERLYGYNDDAERFACFSYAVLELIKINQFYPDIMHINDWQTAMIPYLLDTHYRHQNEYYHKIHTLLTIHNLEYQGNFDPYVSRFFNTDFNYTYIHFNRVNFLKAGIERATKINTVSPSYRNEILTHQFGFTLDGALNARSKDLTGILNGIDTDVFDPKRDNFLHQNFTSTSFVSGKKANKQMILETFNMDLDTKRPMIAYIGRLASQKGIDILKEVIGEVLDYSNATLFLMGSGDDAYQNYFNYLKFAYPDRVGTYIGFNESVAHKVYAAADLFVMPSRFEPCGLGQMIAMNYGTLPIVRETGGLKDSVIPFNKYTNEGTGFSFMNYTAYDLKEKLFEAINLYNLDQKVFKQMIKQAMKQDFSIEKMALNYIKLYKEMLGE